MEWVPDLRQIRAFVAVAEEGSFTLAAKRTFVTQSAVSHSLRILEEQLGCKLLDRSGKRVVTTAEGDLLLVRCRGVLYEIDQVSTDLEGLRRWGQTTIRIGAPHSLCLSLIPSILREFRDCFPRCDPSIEVGDSSSLLSQLAEGNLDLVVGLKTREHFKDGYRPMFRDRLAFVVSPLHPWAREGAEIQSTLQEQQYIVYAKATETHRLIENWMNQHIGKSNRSLVLGDMQAIKEMAKIGIGVGIVAPWVAAREIEEGSLKIIEMQEPKIEREWGVFHSMKREPSLVEEAFIGLCEMAFSMMPGA